VPENKTLAVLPRYETCEMIPMELATENNETSVMLKLTPETIRLGGSILSRNPGCEDPLS
jgi:hypothetical protein